jgi:hypothetical protein
MKSDLSKVKIGDKIWTIQEGWVKVVRIGSFTENYPIMTQCGTAFNLNGKWALDDKHPSAFLEYPFKEQEIEKDTLVWFRDYEYEPWSVGYYSNFENGNHYTFQASKKSNETSDIHSWNIVTTENPLL